MIPFIPEILPLVWKYSVPAIWCQYPTFSFPFGSGKAKRGHYWMCLPKIQHSTADSTSSANWLTLFLGRCPRQCWPAGTEDPRELASRDPPLRESQRDPQVLLCKLIIDGVHSKGGLWSRNRSHPSSACHKLPVPTSYIDLLNFLEVVDQHLLQDCNVTRKLGCSQVKDSISLSCFQLEWILLLSCLVWSASSDHGR